MRISDWSSDVCSSDLKISRLGNAVDVAVEKHASVAERALNKAKAIAEKSGLTAQILSIENSFSKSRNEPAFVFSSLEQLLELSPDDHSKRLDRTSTRLNSSH